MSLLFLSAISTALFSVSATGAPCCSPAPVPAGWAAAVACPPGACSTAAVCACALAPNTNNHAAPPATAIVFLIPPLLLPPPALFQTVGAGLVYPGKAPPDQSCPTHTATTQSAAA